MITYAQMCDAITAYLATAASLKRTESYDELSEGMQDTPTIQVYPEGCETVSADSGTHVATFGGGSGTPVIQETHIINVDYYARQRSHLGEDMAALVTGIDEIVTLLEAAHECPHFGLDGIKNYQWSWRRVIFDYGGQDNKYMGARFTITLRTF